MKFTEFALHPSIQAGIDELGFVECTPIQETSIPHILDGRDVAGLAQTGTGKTAAFLLPLMDRIVRSRETGGLPGQIQTETHIEPAVESANQESAQPATPQEGESEKRSEVRPIFKNWRKSNFILVLVPTRELAEQVCENAAKFGKHAGLRAASIYGGTGYEAQKAALRSAVEFIVATPGRLIDLYKENLVDLGQVRAVVFDEADRMFDMGFKDDMKYILRRIPKERQFLVFSATLNFDVLNTAYEFGADPTEVNVSRDQAKAENVDDEIFHIGQGEKPQFLLSLIQKYQPRQAIIFSNFKHNIDRVAKFLSTNGVPALGISSLISQSQRTRIMEMFKDDSNDRNVLVATDLAARGLDIKGVDLIVNFELPEDAENYVHRIGRTGRAGAKGRAISLVSDRDVEALQRIENYLGHKITISWLDEADIAKEFKPIVHDGPHGRHSAGSGHGHRPAGGPRRDFAHSKRPRGPRREYGEQRQQGEQRTHGEQNSNRDQHRAQSEQRPHGERPHGDQRQYGERHHGEQKPWRHGQRHHNDQRSGKGPHPDRGQRHSNRRDNQSRDNQGRDNQSGQHSGQRHNRPHQQHRTGYTHRPGSSANTKPTKAAPISSTAGGPGVVSKVKGFFRRIFG